jgi:hypothetical protein
MLNYLKKFTMDILPSVAATIIGAYIVNHYIVTRPETPAAAAVSASDAKISDAKASDAKTSDAKTSDAKSSDAKSSAPKTTDPKAAADAKPAEKPTQVSSLPEAGVKAKGMSERTLIERSASEKATVVEKPQDKPADPKSVDLKPTTDASAETASIPAEPHRHQVAPRDKTAVRVVLPSPVQPVAPAAVPAPAVEAAVAPAAVAPDERRDANDLARAAIERLRNDNAQRTPEPAHAPEVARNPEAPRIATAPAIRPLPPPIMVSNPSADNLDQRAARPPYAPARIDDPSRPTPPADIPLAPRPPLDLHAEATVPPATKEHTTVAEDMLSAAKSVFHAVLPK